MRLIVTLLCNTNKNSLLIFYINVIIINVNSMISVAISGLLSVLLEYEYF